VLLVAVIAKGTRQQRSLYRTVQRAQEANSGYTQDRSDAMLAMIVVQSARGLVVIVAGGGLFLAVVARGNSRAKRRVNRAASRERFTSSTSAPLSRGAASHEPRQYRGTYARLRIPCLSTLDRPVVV
jgi:hypothetical protein